jgi:hypothetical protein
MPAKRLSMKIDLRTNLRAIVLLHAVASLLMLTTAEAQNATKTTDIAFSTLSSILGPPR